MSEIFHSRAPARIDFAGGGSDCPPFSSEFGGAVVNGAIRQYVYTTLEVQPDTEAIAIVSPEMGQAVQIPSVAAIEEGGELDLVKFIIKELSPDFGFRLKVDSALPPGCGLSTSAAVGTATAAAVALAMGRELTQLEAFRLSVRVEREILQWPGGSQDQYAAAVGGLNTIEFDGLEAEGRRLNIPPELVWELEKHLLLCHTGEAHLSGSIHTDIREAYADPESACRKAMHELKKIGQDLRDALERSDLAAFGEILNRNWAAHQDLHESCNNARLRRFYDIIRQHDAAGAKTCGAGGGGCIVVYHPGPERNDLEAALKAEGGQMFDVLFDQEGTVAWKGIGRV